MPTTIESRRDALRKITASAAAIGLAQMTLPAFVFPGQADEEDLVPFLDMPRAKPGMLDWETLTEWITPQDQVFSVSHYGVPTVKAEDYALEITGLVEKPRKFTLAELQGLPQRDQLMTLECSGNGASKGFMGAVYNSKWTGTQLAPLLQLCGIKPEATEVVFIGADRKKETIKQAEVEVAFGRSMSVANALDPNLLLVHQRNGKPLEPGNGFPVRLLVPGWYGIANVKWLTRIEIRAGRYMGRFMARDYVTLRGEKRGDQIEYVETSVSRMNLKSIIARITRRPAKDGLVPVKAYGAVWSDGTEVKKVEIQIDGGDWREAKLDKEPRSKYCWTFFSLDAGGLKPGKHTLVSRAIDATGRIQPAATDDEIALKKTYYEAYQQWSREIELTA
ncbi:MAG: sulfite oxidase [Planctomycetales bacterium]|nr:sulfite oxidase [Planctomycetales bacterium]